MQVLQKDIIEWDVANWSTILHLWQPVIDKFPKNSRILAIGERNGGLSLWLALQGYSVVCTDRVAPSENARQLHQRYGVSHRITYRTIDIVTDSFVDEKYDIILFKSVLGGVKEKYNEAETRNENARKKAINNIYNMLNAGGCMLAAENMEGSKILYYLRARNGKQNGWHYFNADELKQLCCIFPSVQIQSFGIIPTLFSLSFINKIIHLLNVYFLAWLPQSTHYIASVVATKSK